MNTDPIADMATRIRNAILAGHETVEIPSSRMKVGIARILKEQGYIEEYSVIEDKLQGVLKVYLKYRNYGVDAVSGVQRAGRAGARESVITGIQRASKPGRRVYVGKDAIPSVQKGLGVTVMSTPQGLMIGEEARKRGIGGEVLLTVW
ncbi:MAG TPA: 30S ribosomal protein S8 [Myxococcota bacterium]|nr:30S ribosomal protein S8 [Myxococcota bacterium]HNZ02623.1 30S ribosomal protein S8 [Myxococcota bacterium]HOD08170.1 30S ribosomal protein S8 [Myxococcota bacterium]HPB50309.1 30S ribosomal protein S8 [Myxococcota bacterium]HQP95861.1 30S ribosomal protein S8 [Myxococcota bacterium]